MNKLRISIFAIALSLMAFSCGESVEFGNTEDTNSEVGTDKQTIANNVNADEFESLIQKGGFLIDVRTPGELEDGAIEGHTNINFSASDFQSEIDKLDKNLSILVYCGSGGRSGKTMSMMKDMGFKEVYNLKGGYSNWPYK